MSATPRLDAVKAWRDGDLSELIEWPTDPPGWPPFADDAERRRYAIGRCASGVPAELPRRHLVVTEVATGRRIPPPPRRSKQPRRKRKP